MNQIQSIRAVAVQVAAVTGMIALLASCKSSVVKNDPKDTMVRTDTPAIQEAASKSEPQAADTANPFPVKGKTTAAFVPEGYEVGMEAEGLLDNDNLPDQVIVLNHKSERAAARPCLVLLQETGGGYRLAHTSWKAIQPELTQDGYPIYDSEDMTIENHVLSIDRFSPGPAGNLNTIYQYKGASLLLTRVHTYNMGAGSHTEVEYNLANGKYEQTVINTMTDSTPSETIIKSYTLPDALFEDADPLELIHIAYDKATAK